AGLEALSDPQMMNELSTQLTRAGAPAPSVEAILHATLPHKYVDHTHADAVLAVTNTQHGADYVREIYGEAVVVIPYVMPGFDLARVCARKFAAEAHAGTIGMVLMNHGVFSFGATARESYERMIDLVTRAERFLERRGAWTVGQSESRREGTPLPLELAKLRSEISACAGAPMIVATETGGKLAAFARR